MTRPSSAAEMRRKQALDLKRAYDAGSGVDDLVSASGLSHGTVLNRLRSVGTVMRTPAETRRMRTSQVRRELAASLKVRYEAGASVESLAVDVHRSVRTVRRLLAEVGTTLRSTGETRRLSRAGELTAHTQLGTALRGRYEAHERVPFLAEELGVSTSKVYRLLHEAGTPLRRPRREGPRASPPRPP